MTRRCHEGERGATAMLGAVAERRYGQGVDQPLSGPGVQMRLAVTEFRDGPAGAAVKALQEWLASAPEAREVCEVLVRSDALVVVHRDPVHDA